MGRANRLVGTMVAAVMQVTPALAQDARRYEIEAQPLGAALRAFAAASGREVLVDSQIVEGKAAPALIGRFDAARAIAALLRNSGLRATVVDGAFVIRVEDASIVPANDVVVTGTRIRGGIPAGSPLTVIDRAAIDRSGRGTVESLLQTLPANFGGGANVQTAGITIRGDAGFNTVGGSSINLRGLGAGSTLVLFDGNRPALAGLGGTFADTSLIPLLAIERIEVLSDGASALYGSDSVAGVVNFRFRNKFDGAESWARSGTADGDFGEYQVGQIVGRKWRTGSATIAYEYSHRDRLPGDKRRFSTEDLRAFGGPDDRSFYAAPGNVIAADGSRYTIPAGQDGTLLQESDLLSGGSNRRDQRRSLDLLPQQTSHSVYAALDQQLFGPIGGYARMFWARRVIDARRDRSLASPTVVPASNAYYVDPIGTGEPVFVQYDFSRDLGTQHARGKATGFMGVGGLTADMGNWHFEANGSYGVQRERATALNSVNAARLAVALADANPATAYNVFGDGVDTNGATIARVRGSSSTRTRYAVWTAALRADGPLIDWSAGTIRVATGVEHRREALDYRSIDDTFALVPQAFAGTPANRNVDAIYGELLVPLAGHDARWLPGSLDLSLAGRIEWYDAFGRTANPKVGLSWRPVRGVTLRGSYGRSFRAPTFTEQAGAANNLSATLRIPDPLSATGTSDVLALLGYDPAIGPERATNWTAGVDLRDIGLAGLNLSMTYFSIDYRDRIASVEEDFASFLTRREIYGGLITETPDPDVVASYYAAPRFFNLLGIPVSGVEKVIDVRTRNLSRVTVKGIDFDLRLQRPLGGGEVQLGVAGTRLLTYDEKLTDLAPPSASLGTTGRPVRLRLRSDIGWSTDRFAIGGFVNYTDSYSNQLVNPAEAVSAWTTIDAQVSYRITDPGSARTARIALSATNLFDRDPPYVAYRTPVTTIGYDPEQASPASRLISLQVTVGW